MTQEQFIYWLRGFITGKDYISAQDTLTLKEQAEKVCVVAFSPSFNPYTPWSDKTTTIPCEGPTSTT